MSFNEYILLLTLVAIVVGWFVNNQFQKKREIIKKRMNHRIEMLENYLLFFKKANDNKNLDGFNDIQVSFLMYGYDDEKNLIKEIVEIIEIINDKTVKEQPNDQKKLTDKLIELNILSINKLRVELQLPEIKA